tara:strand:+ start:76 stop:435 length:360 start_codon:yes stop_codon:yes gene_type:complete
MVKVQSSINPDDEQIERVSNIIYAATKVRVSRRELCNIIREILHTRPPLTKNEVRILNVLKQHYASHNVAMTLRGLMSAWGSKSLGHTHKIVNDLCDKGYVVQISWKYVPVEKIELLES